MSSLGDIFTTAIHSNTTSARTLLSYRSYTKHNTLLAFLHILFVFVIGLFFLPTIYFANCIEEDLTYIGLVKGITALAGAVLLEILLNIFPLMMVEILKKLQMVLYGSALKKRL